MGVMKVMDRKGDTKIEWNRDNPAEVQIAREAFVSATKKKSDGGKGYLAYKVGKEGSKGEVVKVFDPYAEKLILAPPMAGG